MGESRTRSAARPVGPAAGGTVPAADGPSPAAAPAPAAEGRPPARSRESSGALPTRRARRRYLIVLSSLLILALGLAAAHLAIGNPMPPGSRGFWIIAELRATSLLVMLICAVCQGLATVTFQTVTTNRIITPSIMGFESLYIAIQTTAVYLLGIGGVTALIGPVPFLLQVGAMVGLSVALYGWLLSGRNANLQIMLLIGIIIGGGLGSVSAFMRRLLTPSEFDVLAAQMFGSVTTAEDEYLPYAIPLVLLASVLLLLRTRRLDVLALGPEQSTNLGLNHRREVIGSLVLVSVLMAVSTALIGPMTFFGFLVATLAYQAADTYDHRLLLPVAVLIGFVVLAGAYVVMNHVFYAEGVVSIIIELVGGSVFLAIILRKGRL